MRFQNNRCRTWDLGVAEPSKISHLLFCPDLYHLSWVVSVVTMSKPIFAANISISVFERQDGCLVDFNRSMLAIFAQCVIDISL